MVFKECKSLYQDMYTPLNAKLMIYKSKEEAIDKYGIEICDFSKKQMDEIDKLQMKHIKGVMKCHESNRNSLLRIMLGVHKYNFVRKQRTINLIRKLRGQAMDRGPRKLILNWEESQNTDNNMKKSNCRRTWEENRTEIEEATKGETKENWFKQERAELYGRLASSKKLPTAVRNYTGMKNYDTDPIINVLSSKEFSTWINAIDGGHPMYWKINTCTLCGKQADGAHIMETCEKINCANDIVTSLDVDSSLNIRRDAIKRIISHVKKHNERTEQDKQTETLNSEQLELQTKELSTILASIKSPESGDSKNVT